MYQDYSDMVEDEHLRARIRNILEDQIRARGYGHEIHAQLGARDTYTRMLGPESVPHGPTVPRDSMNQGAGVMLGGAGKQTEWTKCISRWRGAKNAKRMYNKKDKKCKPCGKGSGVPVGGVKTRSKRGRKLNPWQEFVSAHKGHGYSLKELSAMYKRQNRGGVAVGGCDDCEGPLGGYYLR